MPASLTPVRPTRAISASAVSSAAAFSAAVSAGTWVSTSSVAPSTNTPAGLPCASRSMRPPAGSAVARVTPASLIAALLAHAAWPSTRLNQTGRSATAASSSVAVGKRPSFQITWFQPPPRIHFACGCACAYAFTLASASSSERVSLRSTLLRA